MHNITPDIAVVSNKSVLAGYVATTPDQPAPYKVVFHVGDRIVSEHAVMSVRSGESMIRNRLPAVSGS